MVSPDQENRRGIMNDWDLSFDREGALQHVGGERTGTVPFMALDLLTDNTGPALFLVCIVTIWKV